MDLIDALRSTGAVREFTPEPVPDDVLARVLDNARFAPSGGNGQGWHVVVIADPAKKAAVRDLYLPGWYDYLAIGGAGLRPWSPCNDRAAETEAMQGAAAVRAQAEAGPGGFAEHLDTVPVLLALFVDLGVVAGMVRDFDRYPFAGGASIYPFAWNVLLAARAEGLGGVITTMNIRQEPAMKALLDAPDHFALAGVIALGHPKHQVSRLKRAPVEEFATVDSLSGRPFSAPDG
jgi:nitroreductase